MPQSDERKRQYPADWSEIRSEVLARASNRCEGFLGALTGKVEANGRPGERCGAPNGQYIQRHHSQSWRWVVAGDGGRDFAEPIRVVLTVAHVDQNPRNNDRSNLRAWCQRCHLEFDREFQHG